MEYTYYSNSFCFSQNSFREARRQFFGNFWRLRLRVLFFLTAPAPGFFFKAAPAPGVKNNRLLPAPAPQPWNKPIIFYCRNFFIVYVLAKEEFVKMNKDNQVGSIKTEFFKPPDCSAEDRLRTTGGHYGLPMETILEIWILDDNRPMNHVTVWRHKN